MYLGQGNVVIRDYGSSLSCPHRKLNLKQSSGSLANGSKVQRKQEAVGNFPFVQFPITSYVKLALVSLHYSEDQCCHVVKHTHFLSLTAKLPLLAHVQGGLHLVFLEVTVCHRGYPQKQKIEPK